MLALLLAVIVVGIIFQVLTGQGQFARSQTAREEVQQNARMALHVIASELRGVGPEGILATGPDSIRFRSPRAWGVVCAFQSGALSLLFPPGLSGSFKPGQEDSIGIIGRTALGFAGGPDVTASGGVEVAQCNGAVTPNPPAQASAPADARARRFTLAAGAPAAADTGVAAYLFDVVRYDVAASSGVQGSWIRRNNQPMAGPVPATGGLQFTFRRANGTVIAAPNAATRDSIAQIDIAVRTESQARFNNRPQQDTAATTVYLRNRG